MAALTTNMIIGGIAKDDSGDEWLNLDQKVNSYPNEPRIYNNWYWR